LAIFPPWAVEEIACVYNYVFKRYDPIFAEVAEDPKKYRANYPWLPDYNESLGDHGSDLDISEEGEQFRTPVSALIGFLILPRGIFRSEYLEGSTALGLPFLHKVTSDVGLEAKRELITDNLSTIYPSLPHALEEEPASYIYSP
jgi:hypothetical protein